MDGRRRRSMHVALAASLGACSGGCLISSAAQKALMVEGPDAVKELADCSAQPAANGGTDVTLLFQLQSRKIWRADATSSSGRLTSHGPSKEQKLETPLHGIVTDQTEVRLAPRARGCLAVKELRSRAGMIYAEGPGAGESGPFSGRSGIVTEEEWRRSVLVHFSGEDQEILRIRVPPPEGRGAAGDGDAVLGPFTLDRHDRPVLGTVAFAAVVPFTIIADIIISPVVGVIYLSHLGDVR